MEVLSAEDSPVRPSCALKEAPTYAPGSEAETPEAEPWKDAARGRNGWCKMREKAESVNLGQVMEDVAP